MSASRAYAGRGATASDLPEDLARPRLVADVARSEREDHAELGRRLLRRGKRPDEVRERLAPAGEAVRLRERRGRLGRGDAPVELLGERDRAVPALHVLRAERLVVEAVDPREDRVRLAGAPRERHPEMRPAERRRQEDERARRDRLLGRKPDLLTRPVRPPRRRLQRGEDVASRETPREEPRVHAQRRQRAWFATSWIGRSRTPSAGIGLGREGRERALLRLREDARLDRRVVPGEDGVGLERAERVDGHAEPEERGEGRGGKRRRRERRRRREERHERDEEPRAPARRAVPRPPRRRRDEQERARTPRARARGRGASARGARRPRRRGARAGSRGRGPCSGPTVSRQRPSSGGWLKRSPPYEANGRPKRTISKASQSAASGAAPREERERRARRACRAEPRGRRRGRRAGRRTTKIDFESRANPARAPAPAARSAGPPRARRAPASAAHAKAPPTHAAWSGSDQSDDAYAQSGDAIAARAPRAARRARLAPHARARRPARERREEDEEDLLEDEERLRRSRGRTRSRTRPRRPRRARARATGPSRSASRRRRPAARCPRGALARSRSPRARPSRTPCAS